MAEGGGGAPFDERANAMTQPHATMRAMPENEYQPRQ
jgi:hypothetical protein